jgi:phage replication O-like protein O
MARTFGNPQLEDGYARIANEILDALSRTRLSDYESRCIHFLWRKTYGWHDKRGKTKKDDAISFGQWSDGTGVDRRNIIRTLAGLTKRRIIQRTTVSLPGRNITNIWNFNKHYLEWEGFEAKPVATETPVQLELVATETPVQSQVVAVETPLSYKPVSVDAKVVSVETLEVVSVETPTIDNKDTITIDNVGDSPKKENSPAEAEARTPKRSTNPFIAEMQKKLGFPENGKPDPIPNPAKEAGFVKKMLNRGFTWEQILAVWHQKCSARGEFVSMQWVNEDIGGNDGTNKLRRGATVGTADTLPVDLRAGLGGPEAVIHRKSRRD